jgi:hypothetical protein
MINVLRVSVPRLIPLACGAGLSLLAAPALGSPYDDCILQHMGTAQNQAAVHAIERACIAKTSIGIAEGTDLVRATVGKFKMGFSFQNGLLVELKNTTQFHITELIVTVQNKDTNKITEYPVDSFIMPTDLPPGYVITGLPETIAFMQIIPSGKTRTFFVHVTEVTDKFADFPKKFSWGIILTKGIPAN